MTKKILHSLRQGTEMGWLIDPNERSLFVYLPNQSTEVFDQPEEILPSPSFASQFSMKLGDLFDILMIEI